MARSAAWCRQSCWVHLSAAAAERVTANYIYDATCDYGHTSSCCVTRTGSDCAARVAQKAAAAGAPLHRMSEILDFGYGCGRTMQFIGDMTGAALTA
jgi:hypothetical protein